MNSKASDVSEGVRDALNAAYQRGYGDGFVDAQPEPPDNEADVHRIMDTGAIGDGWSQFLDSDGDKLILALTPLVAGGAILRKALLDCAGVPVWRRDRFLSERINEALATLSPPLPSLEVERRALRLLARHTCFSAYSAAEPLCIHFDFGSEADRIAAANALDEAFAALSALPLDGGLSSD